MRFAIRREGKDPKEKGVVKEKMAQTIDEYLIQAHEAQTEGHRISIIYPENL